MQGIVNADVLMDAASDPLAVVLHMLAKRQAPMVTKGPQASTLTKAGH